jgi:hypothetical protein
MNGEKPAFSGQDINRALWVSIKERSNAKWSIFSDIFSTSSDTFIQLTLNKKLKKRKSNFPNLAARTRD